MPYHYSNKKNAPPQNKKAKPDFLDLDKDGNKKESMKKAVADMKGKRQITRKKNPTKAAVMSKAKDSKPKKTRTLTTRQENALQRHKEHHTAKHMALMRKLMREGKTFGEAHKIAMKEVGK